MPKSDLSQLPSVDQVLKSRTAAELIAAYGRPLCLEAIRQTLNEVRDQFPTDRTIPSKGVLLNRAQALLASWTAPTLQAVINASGVVLHTNLGRAPLSQEAIFAMTAAAQSYSNLEYDLDTGKRGSRLLHAEDLLVRLTGAEAALVVNNAASAVMLMLKTLANRRRVAIARSQLVEIGGGFRIPDVMKQSGAILVEVGATNRVYVSDYEKAIEEQPIYTLMRVHRSNFDIVGFTAEPTLEELAQLARQHELPLVDDLGSGALLDTARFGLRHEPTVQESLDAGADLVCFSGDKLLGGPQAGVILGRADLVAKLKRHPLARAIRADKLCLAALSATLLHYLKDEAEREIPIWRMIATEPKLVRARAENWAEQLETGVVIPGESTVGGGSLPGETLPTFLLALDSAHPNRLLDSLRAAHPPIIARLQEDQVILDPRTVLPEQEGALLVGLQNALVKNK